MFRKRFLKYFLKHLPIILCGVAVLVIIDIYQLKIPEKTGDVVEVFRKSKTLGLVNTKSIVSKKILDIILLAILVLIGRVMWRLYLFGTSRDISNSIRKDLFSHSLKLSKEYYSKNKVGATMSYFTNDVDAVRAIYGEGMLFLVDGVFLLSFALYKMFKISPRLTLVGMIPIFVLLATFQALRQEMSEKFEKKQKSFESLSEFVQESFSGFLLIRAYVREIFERVRFNKEKENNAKMTIDFKIVETKYNIFTGFLITLSFILIVGYGSYVVVFGKLNPGNLVTFISLYALLEWPLMAIVELLKVLTKAHESAKRLNNFLDEKIEIKDKDTTLYDKTLKGSVEFKKLSFKYPKDEKYALKDISFKINKGESVGILGQTGSGKSTIVDLLLRLYNVEDNTLFFDGVDVNNIKIKKIREIIGYVPQDNFLFSDTIKNNISFANTQINDEQIVDAAKNSSIYFNIMDFKEGFHTKIGERGTLISGGQKQRISIARAIAKNPEILILDDSVSAVDIKTEKEILANLKEIRQNKTTIIVSHRISTIKNLNKIIFLKDGEVKAIGSHKELLNKSKLYKEYVFVQENNYHREEGFYEGIN